jgi:uncharacterized protein (DUF169 family)
LKPEWSIRQIFYTLQQIGNFLVGIAVMGIFYIRTLSKQGVSFIKNSIQFLPLESVEQYFKILLRFTDVFTDHL